MKIYYYICLFSKCLQILVFPTVWNRGKIICLINKPDKNKEDVNAYRHITLIPTLAKILKKLILSKLNKELEKNEVLHQNQFAFRRGYFIERAADKLIRTIKKLKPRKRQVLLLSFDVSWTFNQIKWSSIVDTLLENNINIPLLILIQNFLINRTVGYYDEDDQVIHELFAGVPQGSALGPMLFDVAMSVVHRLILQKIGFHHNTEVISYADDAQWCL